MDREKTNKILVICLILLVLTGALQFFVFNTVSKQRSSKKIIQLEGDNSSYFLATKSTNKLKMDLTGLPFKNQSVIINVTRSYMISHHLYVYFNDTIAIENNDTMLFNAFMLYYEKTFWEKLTNIRVLGKHIRDENYTKLEWSLYIATEHYVSLYIRFDRALEKGDKYILSILADAIGLIYFEGQLINLKFYLNVTQRPLIPYNIRYARVRCIPPHGVEVLFDQITPTENKGRKGDEVFWTLENLKAFNDSTLPSQLTKINFMYTYDQLPLKILYIKRSITIDLDGTIHGKEVIKVYAVSPEKQTTFVEKKWDAKSVILGLPEHVNIENIKVKDVYGKISFRERAEYATGRFENYTFIEVSFRNPLLGGETYEFTIEYTIPWKEGLKHKKDKYLLRISIFPILNASIGSVILEIRSPYNFNIENDLEHRAVYSKKLVEMGPLALIHYNVIRFEFSHIMPSFNNIIKISFSFQITPLLSLILASFQLLLVPVLLFSLIIRSISILKVKIRVEELPELRRRRENLIKFIAICEEYLAVEEEIQKSLTEKILIKRPTTKVLRDIRIQIDELGKRRGILHDFGERVGIDPEVRDLVEQIKVIDARIEVERKKIIDDLTKYLRGLMKRTQFTSSAEETIKILNSELLRKRRILNKLKDILIVKYSIE